MAATFTLISIFRVLIVSICFASLSSLGPAQGVSIGLVYRPVPGLALGLPRMALSGGLVCESTTASRSSGTRLHPQSCRHKLRTFSGLLDRNPGCSCTPKPVSARGSALIFSYFFYPVQQFTCWNNLVALRSVVRSNKLFSGSGARVNRSTTQTEHFFRKKISIQRVIFENSYCESG